MTRTTRTARRGAVSLIALAILATGCRGGDPTVPPGGPPAPETVTPPPETVTPTPTPTTPAPPTETVTAVTTVATGLAAPWGIAFLPDGSALVSERDSGRLLTVTAAGVVTPVGQIEAAGSNEGGLLGVAVSPTYATDSLVYAYYTTETDNRVVRFALDAAAEPEVVLEGIPAAGIHNGGRIAFGPDGNLYIGTGDANENAIAQDPASLGGKILRVTPDGEVPADNPIAGSPVYSLGHRNVQGLTWNAAGQLYATELGQNTFDEVNVIAAGGNYGWPTVEGPGAVAGFVDPVATFTTAEASPSGATFLVGGAVPQWEGDLFVAALRGKQLWHLGFGADGAVSEQEALIPAEYGRLRAAAQAPDGSLWVLTSNLDGRGEDLADGLGDRIVRLGPVAAPAAP